MAAVSGAENPQVIRWLVPGFLFSHVGVMSPSLNSENKYYQRTVFPLLSSREWPQRITDTPLDLAR